MTPAFTYPQVPAPGDVELLLLPGKAGGSLNGLGDDLLARGYTNVSVLDISPTAIDANRKRLGKASEQVHWLVSDITRVKLEPAAYDVWHDRAVFHFLTAACDRAAYVRQVAQAVIFAESAKFPMVSFLQFAFSSWTDT